MSISNVSGGLPPLSLPQKSGDELPKRQQDGKGGAQDKNDDKKSFNPNADANPDKGGNHATDVGINSHLMTPEEREAMVKKARQDAVDLSRLNLRIARARDHSKMMDDDMAESLKSQLVASFANLKTDDASAIYKAKRVVNVPIAQELAEKTIRHKASETAISLEEHQDKMQKIRDSENAGENIFEEKPAPSSKTSAKTSGGKS